jgi:hypothetical protein
MSLQMKRMFLFSLIALPLVSCMSPTIKSGAPIGTALSDSEYSKLMSTNTEHKIEYDGFYNKFEVFVTYMNSDVQSAYLQRRSDVLQWDVKTAQTERDKMFQENSTQTKFSMSLFTPTSRLNDLHKGTSIWKLYLEVDGQRYEGKPSKRNIKLEDHIALFPQHNRWSTPYEIVFQNPLSISEKSDVKFIITSSQGSAEFTFPKQ